MRFSPPPLTFVSQPRVHEVPNLDPINTSSPPTPPKHTNNSGLTQHTKRLKQFFRNFNQVYNSLEKWADEVQGQRCEHRHAAKELIWDAYTKGKSDLHLGDLDLGALPECIGELRKLKTLSLNNTGLRELPTNLGKLKKLQVLDLSDNLLEKLPECVGNLSTLKALSLRKTGLRELPTNLGKLQNLEWLDLSGNLLETLPECVGNLSTLKALSLRKTGLSKLPTNLGKLQNLERLDLSGNQLEKLPEFIFKKGKGAQRYIIIEGNPLWHIPVDSEKDFNAKEIKIGQSKSGNWISSLPVEIGNVHRVNFEWIRDRSIDSETIECAVELMGGCFFDTFDNQESTALLQLIMDASHWDGVETFKFNRGGEDSSFEMSDMSQLEQMTSLQKMEILQFEVPKLYRLYAIHLPAEAAK